ncbi:tripartite tricarboxylate transporter substrate binding protein [Roseomonas sp. NAR14]|uniref:Tripartite tricarboxylate transporter substrate binding protein n=1 Tax=Roseomonas acroporae TaxID=2937791 RepID=A0A9X2BUW2_9PROT|nr:tripartite tricarboxylate transporter substrate binding protein [Roseomonas acroporae]MCK8785997.1 tripartite tricarboxylate transporter substrate binding protein [Roseomonas acroporae]
MSVPRRRALLQATLALPMARALRASAQDGPYPDRPITVISPWAAGGSSDSFLRILAQYLTGELGQSVVVENRSGAAGTVGHAYAARAKPDGYTLLFGTNSTYAIAPFLYDNLPYDNDRAFAPIMLAGTNPQVLCVSKTLPVTDFAGFLAYARAGQDRLTFASSGIGGTSHLATELLMSMGGFSMLHVPYRGGGPAAQALVAGEVGVDFIDAITAKPLVEGGVVRAIGISSRERARLFPAVPTIAEAGLPGFESSTDFAWFAPAGTPEPIIRRLLAAGQKALRDPAVRERVMAQGIEPIGSGPAEFAAYLAREKAKWGEIIRSRNIRLAP